MTSGSGAPWQERLFRVAAPIEHVGSTWTGSLQFLSSHPEGSRWVDAGTIQALLYQLIEHVPSSDAGPCGPASLAIDVVGMVRREREMRFVLELDSGGESMREFRVTIYDGDEAMVLGRGTVQLLDSALGR